MRKVLLTSAAVGALLALALPASAADLGVRSYAAPSYVAPAAPVFTWTGFYIGGNAGAAWRENDDVLFESAFLPGVVVTNNGFFGCGVGFDCGHGNRAVFTGGGQAGMNWQFNQFVFGVEGDINYIGNRDRDRFGVVNFTVNGVPFTATQFGDNGDSNWFATLRARGGLAWDRFLLYATGGVAFQGGHDDDVVSIRNNLTGTTSIFTGSTNVSEVGWAVGAGVEYAMTNNISVGLEYLHLGFPSRDFVDPIASVVNRTATFVSVSDDVDLVRAKVNFKFGSLFGY